MAKTTLSFLISDQDKKALDQIADVLDRDRSYVLNQAVEHFIELYQWQISHIKQGLKEAKQNKFVAPEKVKQFFQRSSWNWPGL